MRVVCAESSRMSSRKPVGLSGICNDHTMPDFRSRTAEGVWDDKTASRHIPIGVHVALAAGVLAIAYPLGDGWLAMLDSYVRAFFSSTAFSFIC